MLFFLFCQSKSAGPARLSKNLSLQEALEMASARGRKFKSVDENMDFLDVEIQQHLMEELMVTRNEAKEVAEELEIDDPLDIYCRLVAMKEFGMYSIFEKAQDKSSWWRNAFGNGEEGDADVEMEEDEQEEEELPVSPPTNYVQTNLEVGNKLNFPV